MGPIHLPDELERIIQQQIAEAGRTATTATPTEILAEIRLLGGRTPSEAPSLLRANRGAHEACEGLAQAATANLTPRPT